MAVHCWVPGLGWVTAVAWVHRNAISNAAQGLQAEQHWNSTGRSSFLPLFALISNCCASCSVPSMDRPCRLKLGGWGWLKVLNYHVSLYC